MSEKNQEKDNGMEYAKKKLKKKVPTLIIIVVILLGAVIYGLISESCFIQDIREPNDVDVKPVIYLYPEEKIDLEVTIPTVEFTTTYPLYKDGWKVSAQPNGLLNDGTRQYKYLYWEGYTGYDLDMSEGFIVSKDNYIDFLEEKLEYVGLSDKEACDFITYWLPLMNEYAYCQVSFQKDYGEKVKINYSIQPDNELVVFVGIKGLDEKIELSEQDLSCYKEFSREGFVVVEWGGRLAE